MNEKEQIKKELEYLSPLLSRLKESGLAQPPVPEGYFRELPEEVLRRIRAEEGLVREKEPPASQPWKERLWAGLAAYWPQRLAAGLATAFILAIAGAYFLWPAGDEGQEVGALSALSQEEAAEYITNNIEEFGLELMLEASVVTADEARELEILPEMKEEELDEYLEEIIDEIELEELEELLN